MYHRDSKRPIPHWLIKCLFLKEYSTDAKALSKEEQNDKMINQRSVDSLTPLWLETGVKIENDSELWTTELLKIQKSILFELRRLGRGRKRKQRIMGKTEKIVANGNKTSLPWKQTVAKGKGRTCLSWQQIAIRLDHIFFGVFSCVVFVTNLVFLIYIQNY